MNTSLPKTDNNFTAHIRRVLPILRSKARRLVRDEEDAADLVQDTLLKAYRYWANFEPDTNLVAWLSTIMKNTFITQYQRTKRQRFVLDTTQNQQLLDSTVNSVVNQALGTLTMADISLAISHLAAVHRDPFMLHVQGFKYYEIANQLDVPIGTVKNRIHVARQQLMKKLVLYHS